MANKEHLKILDQGVEAWNQWREENPDIRPDLANANLSYRNYREHRSLAGINLSYTNLFNTNLHWTTLSKATLKEAFLSKATLYKTSLPAADLTKANLEEADLRDTNLNEADLSGANLKRANLTKVNLTKANLTGTKLTWAKLTRAVLKQANLHEAEVGETTFGNIDFSEANGLDTVRHDGPSTIGIDTIYLSKGNIPEKFLRGAGVPDTFITYIASLTGQAIQYYSCFISYSSRDEEFAQRIHADLQDKGVRCWFAPEDIEGGKKLYDQIDQAIRLHDKLLLVLSEHSIYSEWVMTEIRRARRAELKEKQQKLFPVRLVNVETIKAWECFEADTGKDLAVEIREYFIPDFSHWKDHNAYQQAFHRLLRDLKASG